MNQLAFSKANYLAIRDRLLAEDPDLDDQTLADTVEGLTDLHEVIAAIVRAAVTDEAWPRACAAASTRSKAACRGSSSGLPLIAGSPAMSWSRPRSRRMASDLTISIRAGRPALQIVDETAIPSAYWVVPDPRLDRQSLAAELKKGIEITGACLGSPEPVPSVRAK